jgi:hypothetical protein
MAHQTEVEEIKRSRKRRRCDWCYELIEIGQPYRRWRWFSYGDASTVRVHPECDEARLTMHKLDRYFEEWSPGDFSRGCICDGSCERCEERKAVSISTTCG